MLTKSYLALMTMFTGAFIHGIFMFSVLWNPLSPVFLSEKLVELGKAPPSFIPVNCANEVSGTAGVDCFSLTEWDRLVARTQAYGEDLTMWSEASSQTAEFRVVGGDWANGSQGWLYPIKEKQVLGSYFYGLLVEECG